MNELRLAVRRLTAHRAATLAGVVTLAVAIGAAAATWSLLSAVLLRPLPVASPDRLVVIGEIVERGQNAGSLRNQHMYPLYLHFRDSGIFDGLAAGGSWTLLVGSGDRPMQTAVYFASHDYFDLLGLRLALGRSFTADDDRRGAPLVAVLSDRYWRRTFDADPGVIGRIIAVAGQPTTIVGVAPRGFRGLSLAEAPDLYMPLHTVADVGSRFMNYFAEPVAAHGSSPSAWVTLVGRLRRGASAGQTAARLDSLEPAVTEDATRLVRHFGLTPVNLAAVPEAARAGMARFARLLGATVALLLLIGCGTAGMLLLIRTEARREEFAMRLAMGATRARLARGVLVEGALLSLAGTVLAMPVAHWLFRGVRAFELPGRLSIELLELSIDAGVLAAAAGAAVFATLVIALVAGLLASPADIAQALRSRAGSTAARTRRRTRTALVAGQVAVAMVLLAGAGVFARSVMAGLSVNPGFDTPRLVTGSVSLTAYGYTPARATAFFDELGERLRANPAFRSVSLSSSRGSMVGKLVVDGEPRQFPTSVSFMAIDQEYFRTIGVRVTRGRDFTADDRAGSLLVAIVSESFGRALSNGGNPIGHRITMPWRRAGKPADVLEVVGVVPDLITSVSVLEPLVMYSPLAQAEPGPNRSFVLHAGSRPDVARREALGAIRQIDSAVTPGPMLTIDERLAGQMAPQRFGMHVMGALGFIAALLTVVGAYVMAESMTVLRRREMGIRAALGARRAQLFRAVLGQTGRMVGIGLAAGLALSWMGASTIRAFLFRVEPLDPATLATVGAAILVVTLAVSLKPALRAARVDLSQVLREE